MHKLIAYVSGKVQMAGYRSRVVIIAKAFDLKGYVRNLSDSRVKIVAEGSEADLERFLAAIRIENTLIKVEEIKAEFSEAEGAYEEFFKVAGERETDARLDLAADHLKELISVVRDGFKETNSRLCEISGKQDNMIDKIDEAREEIVSTREEIVSEVQGLRSDLKGRTDERLQRIESDVTEIKARMGS
ncbi:MAG TPA: acylphosphatase [Methanothrix sp.]